MSRWALEYSFDVDEEHAIIYAKIFGVWKADTARNYHEDFMAEAAPLLGKPWAKMIDLSNWKTSFPEVIRILGEHMAWSRANNVAVSLFVLNNPSTFRQLQEMFEIGGTKAVSQTFRTYTDAEKYLTEHWINKKHEHQ